MATTIYHSYGAALYGIRQPAVRNRHPANKKSVQNPLDKILNAPFFRSAILLILVIALILIVVLVLIILLIVVLVIVLLILVIIPILIILLVVVLVERHVISSFLCFGNSLA